MVQYLPPPNPDLIFPQHGPGYGAEFGQGLAKGMGNWPQEFGGIFRYNKEKKAQDEWMSMTIGDLIKKLNPQPQPMQGPMQPSGPAIGGRPGMGRGPAPGYSPPNQAPGGSAVPTGQFLMQQRPMMTPEAQLTMKDIAMMHQFSPYLAHQVSQALFPTPQRMMSRLPPETFYVNPKTGEPSLTPREGFMEQMAPAGSGVKALTQWHYRKILEGDKDARLHLTKTIRDMRIADGLNKQFLPVDNALETYKSMLTMRKKMSKSSMDRVQDIVKNPNPNFLVSILRTKDPDATNYYNSLLASKNSLKGMAVNKVSGGKELNDLASLLPDGSEDAMGLKNKMMAFQRATDLIRAKALATARTQEAGLQLNDQDSMVNKMMGLPEVGDLDLGETNDYSEVDKELGL